MSHYLYINPITAANITPTATNMVTGTTCIVSLNLTICLCEISQGVCVESRKVFVRIAQGVCAESHKVFVRNLTRCLCGISQGVCVESQVIIRVFMLFMLHVHNVLPRFSCAQLREKGIVKGITVNNKARCFMCYPKYCIIVCVKDSVGWDCEGQTLNRLEFIK